MPATIEQSTAERAPVFVSGGGGRNHAVRVASAALGLLLIAWLAALAGGLIGFSALPKLALPGAGAARTATAPPDPAAATGHRMQLRTSARGSSLAPRTPSGTRQGNASGGATTGASEEGATAQAGSGQGGSSASSSSSKGGGGSAQSQPTTPPAGTPAQAKPGNQPSFTPPSSGDKSANPPRGKSAGAPGRTVSADPPGKATRPHSG